MHKQPRSGGIVRQEVFLHRIQMVATNTMTISCKASKQVVIILLSFRKEEVHCTCMLITVFNNRFVISCYVYNVHAFISYIVVLGDNELSVANIAT